MKNLKWIDKRTKLPNKDQNVVIKQTNGIVYEAKFNGNSFVNNSGGRFMYVTHWISRKAYNNAQ